jgi:hypothetical protein
LNVELKIRPDIRDPAGTGYPDRDQAGTGYPVSGFLHWPVIRQNQFPVHPYYIVNFSLFWAKKLISGQEDIKIKKNAYSTLVFEYSIVRY